MLTTIPQGQCPDIPRAIAICPICGADIYLDIDEWERLDDGRWRASEHGIHVNCTTEPDLDSDDWDEWFRGHWSMPYVDWLPIEEIVYKWLSDNYRFEMMRNDER